MRRPLPLVLLLVVSATLVAACASAPAAHQPRESPIYAVEVRPLGPATVSGDGFEVRVEFEVTSPWPLERNALVQELRQEIAIEHLDGTVAVRRLSLVEAFQLRLDYVDGAGLRHYRLVAGQRDAHSLYGLQGLARNVARIEVKRSVFAYVANVADADFTPLGFAQLPRNEDGTLETDAGRCFNAEYQAAYETRGRVHQSADRAGLVYEIAYTLAPDGGERPRFVLQKRSGVGHVAPALVRHEHTRRR
ncbi:MAG: hypothetical protein IT463_13850 [Planctomycetes bacterium]|nr:hypothetical protein [Planctomycetota bacterium]